MIIKREGALGDVLMLTPALKAFKMKNPNEPLRVETVVSQVFKNSPYVDEAATILNHKDSTIDLNGAYESDFNTHPVNSFLRRLVGSADVIDKHLDLFPDERDRERVDKWVLNKNLGDFVVVHLGITWVPLSECVMEDVLERLVSEIPVVLVGRKTHKEYYPKTNGIIDLVDAEWTIHELAWLIEKSLLYVGTDTGIMHVAATTNTPIVCCYGPVNPLCRMPFREGVAFEPVSNHSACATPMCAEQNKRIGPSGGVEGIDCSNGFRCASEISTSMIVNAIRRTI